MNKPDWWTSDHWCTPWEVVRRIEAELGAAFDLDPCCRPETAKAPAYFTAAEDGLQQPWTGRIWLNPPYSKPAPWLEKAIAETGPGGAARIVVAILPVRTDTRWFHTFVNGRAEIRFIQGRIKWIGWQGTPIPNPKEPSLFAIYRGEGLT